LFRQRGVDFVEKKMFGGLALMADGKMCVGIMGDELMVRIDPEVYEDVLKRPGAKEMNFTGRPMKGFVFVSGEGIAEDEDLDYWLGLALEFNPRAKRSGKKK
jgi:hypothetical protein